MRARILLGGLLLGGLLLGAGGVARACGVDGVPSLSVDGHLVAINSPLTSTAQFKTWTPFVAPGVYPASHALLLKEDTAKIARALPPLAFKFPWRWRFGDGTVARGAAVSHVYRRPGSYIVSVDAYFAAGKYAQWVTFDEVTLHVR